MNNPNSDKPPAGFVQTEDDLYEPADPQDQSTDVGADDYKDMQIELHGGKRKLKYKWIWDKLK